MTDTETIASVMVEVIRQEMATRDKEIAAIKTKVAELEARPVMKDAGVWKPGAMYREGELVTHGGSGWICNETHSAGGSEPNHKFFRLFVKAGRDARR